MSDSNIELGDIHWLMAILQNIDVGLVVLDRNYNIQLWNGFMESHSGLSPQVARGQNLFEQFREIPKDWFIKKAEPVFQLKTRTFTIWEQRPYLFRFKNYRPITGRASVMYQNTSLIPLESIDRNVNHICLIIYDVTDIAVSRADAQSAQQTLTDMNRIDALTGLWTRDHWLKEVQREVRRCQRSVQPSSLVIFDIDNFRAINGQVGHVVGDEILKTLAGSIQQTLRETDLVCRYGGEVFAALLVDTDDEEAQIFAERIRTMAANLSFTGAPDVTIGLSLGVARVQRDFKDAGDWLMAADKALYHAKHSGGNRTSVFTPGH
ncbi:diguanylate cyclase [Thalassolituus sp. LLYu03]|uniref:diguanylate cyclase n=1 Tax=Thalassolituus sp. LLYu03 TaxID=3421656 RepID=UPI003D2E6787